MLWISPLATAQQAGTRDAPPEGTQGIEGYLSENAMQVLYVRNMDVGQFGQNDVRAGFFLNEARDLIGIVDMLVDVSEPGRLRRDWSLQAGPRAYGALLTVENQDVFSIGLGGRLSYFLRADRETSVSLTAFYAPDIVTFGIADNIKDISLRIETRLTESTRVSVGYRMLEFDLPVDREVDDNVHVGIRYEF